MDKKKRWILSCIFMSVLFLMTGWGTDGVEDTGIFTKKELQNTEMYLNEYWDSNLRPIPAEAYDSLVELLCQVEEVEPSGEPLASGDENDPYLLLKNGDVEYLFCFVDAEEFLSPESLYRYIPLLHVEKTVLKNGTPAECETWTGSLDAASYGKILNLTYCYEEVMLQDGWGDFKKPDQEILLKSEILLMKNAYQAIIRTDDLNYRKSVDDEKTRSEIVRIAAEAKGYMPSVTLPMSLMLGGDGEPAIYFGFDTEDGKIDYMLSFLNSQLQMDDNYLYYDEPAVIISRTDWVKENSYYRQEESSAYLCVISQDDYKWLWELTQG